MGKVSAGLVFDQKIRMMTWPIDIIFLVLAAPFLLLSDWFPQPMVTIALTFLVIPFIWRYLATGQLSRYTLLNPIIAVCTLAILPLSLLLSPSLMEITWPRFTTMAWSITLFFTIINRPLSNSQPVWGSSRMTTASSLYLLLGGIIAIVGVLGMRSVDKLFYLPQVGWLSTALGFENGLPTNEVAGVLTLFIPFAVAVLIGTFRTGSKYVSFGISLILFLMLATLVVSQSRTGLVATFIGVLLVIVMSIRPKMKWVAAALGLGIFGLMFLATTSLGERFLFAGANSWASVIEPRLGIWQQAVDGIRDHSLWGMGFGVFGHVVAQIYPLSPIAEAPILEDAHNLYLQTVLDFGLIGGTLFITLLGITLVKGFQNTRRWSRQFIAYYCLAGLSASLLAHMIYSLTDAVSLGTLASVPLWFLMGLIMARTPDNAPELLNRIHPLVWFSGVIALGIILSGWLWLSLPVNRAGQLTAQEFLDSNRYSAEPSVAVGNLARYRCQAHWFEGLLYQDAGAVTQQTAAWNNLLACTDRYIGYLSVMAPSDVGLAQQAVDQHPLNAAGYFWLATALGEKQTETVIPLYTQGLTLEPDNGRRWQELGNLLVPRDATAAENAYYQSCINGDPGANGCWRAGGLAEARGDLAKAIEYYRLSNFGDAQSRADQLAAQLQSNEQSD